MVYGNARKPFKGGNRQIVIIPFSADTGVRMKSGKYGICLLYTSSPVSARAFRPCIILPMAYLSEEDSKALSYILLHEIQHCRRRDHAVNLFMNLFCIIYWFNPAVWLAGRKMRADRELACDASVLGILQEGDVYKRQVDWFPPPTT